MPANTPTPTLNSIYATLGLNHHRHIRLVRAHEGEDGNISCKLWTVNLDEQPQYVAISYTWGPSTNEEFDRGISAAPTHQIHCNDQPFLVTENLYNFLKRVVRNTELASRSMWIDIISINQEDDNERSEQVKMMASIYASATAVIIWLGEQDNETGNDFDLMRWLADMARRKDQYLERITPQRLDSRETPKLPALYEDVMRWRSLVKFFQRRYFTRVWIIQEVILGRAREAMCGEYTIPWDDIAEVSKFFTVTSWARAIAPGGILTAGGSHPSYYQLPNFIEANRRTLAEGRDEILLYALIRTRRFIASDPRDKVYAVLGIATKYAQGKARLDPVYGNRSVAEAYTLTAIQILEDLDDLLLLAHAEGEEFRQIDSLPSWVPDWSYPHVVGLGITGYARFSASGNLPRSLHIDEENKRLTVKGMKLDEIVQTAETKEEILSGKPFPQLLAIVCAMPRPYPVKGFKQSPFEVLWRSLITDTAGEARVRPAPSTYGHAFSAWFHPKLEELRDAIEEPLISNASRVLSDDELLGSGRRLEAQTDTTEAEEYETVFGHSLHLRPFLTRNQYFGIGSQSVRVKDSIWIIAGSRVPLILRESETEIGSFQIVGGAYVHGFMSGEALESSYSFRDIVIV